MSETRDPNVGQNPYTDPPPIEQRRFHEDPVPQSDADFRQIMQGRGAPAPRPGYEHEQQAVGRPEDTPNEDPAEVAQDQADRVKALQQQQEQLREELKQEPSAPPEGEGIA